jgi:hypothetical protein
MKDLAVSLLALAAFAASAGGWGQLAARVLYRSVVGWPYAIALGLASWVLIGGLLNVSRVAYPVSLYTLFGLGLIFSLVLAYAGLQRQGRSWPTGIMGGIQRSQLVQLIPTVMVLGALIFTVATLLPAAAFNFHDDFHTYFVRPVRMLQTGTLGGNPFDVLGIDSLGAHAFLQAFVVLVAPFAYMDGFDGVFCFALAALLLADMGRRLEIQWPFVAAAVAVYLVIYPQDVNVSTLYAGSATILALMIASFMLLEVLEAADMKSLVMRAIPVGLFLACLVALKLTFVFFAAFYFLTYLAGSLWVSRNRTRTIVAMGACALAALVALLPWMGLNLENYIAALATKGNFTGSASAATPSAADILAVFKPRKLFWGGSVLAYNYSVAVIGVASLLSFLLLARNFDVGRRYYMVPLLSASTAFFASHLTNAFFFDPNTALRYSIPSLIAVLPASVIVLAAGETAGAAAGHSGKWMASSKRLTITFVAAQLISVILFSGAFVDHLHRAYTYRTLVPWPLTDGYLRYNRFALSKGTAEAVRELQSQTKRGKTILAWISIPFYLDFRRNRILTVTEPGLVNPWLNVRTISVTNVRSYLDRWNVRYVLWEYHGPGMKREEELKQYLLSPYVMFRKIGETNLRFRRLLLALGRNSKVIFNNGRFVLFDIGHKGSAHVPGNPRSRNKPN